MHLGELGLELVPATQATPGDQEGLLVVEAGGSQLGRLGAQVLLQFVEALRAQGVSERVAPAPDRCV